MAVTRTSTSSSALVSLVPHAAHPDHDHHVQFYDDHRFLVERVAAFVGEGLLADGGGIVVATPEHLAAVERELTERGIDLARARTEGRFVGADASSTLDRLMVDGVVDGARFRAVIGDIVAAVRGAARGPVRIYGEMIDLLWRRSEPEAMLRLEDLWNELAHEHPFSLLCGYVLAAFADERHVHMFQRVCDRHGHVASSEMLRGYAISDQGTRIIAELEQRARALETEVARRTAAEAEREQLLLAERQARADSELLYRLIDAVNRTRDVDEVYDLALNAIHEATGADRVAILAFDDDGVMRFRAWRGLSDDYRCAVEGHTPWPHGVRDPQPIVVEDTETDATWAAYREVFRAEGIRALAFVPVMFYGRLLGKLMLYGDQPRPFGERDLRMAATVAGKVAQATVRKRAEQELARALEEERRARREAEAAIRAREEILSVVSHDLRNPLGAIMMSAASLLNVEPADKKGPRIRTQAERIHRQAERMARLIEDLVDFAGIQAGALRMEPCPNPPAELIEAAAELFAPLAEERGLTFRTEVAPDLPMVECDCERAVQVLSNLLSNAIKVTAKGGEIAIGAGRGDTDEDEVVFWVRDTGPGIHQADLPRLFERYWRSEHPSYKGAGLGLSIAKGVVEAHGCRIWAESKIGEGSKFLFTLRLAR